MFLRFWKIFLFLFIFFPKNVLAQSNPPVVSPITVQTSGNIEKFAKFEISFAVNTAATNIYFPYDPNPPVGVVGTGVNVDMLLLPPGQANWITQPCFFYYPPAEVGSGSNIQLQPTGQGEWRCRFTPEIIGTWSYKIQAQDSGGTAEKIDPSQQFTVVYSTRKGFIKISQTDPKFFEYSDGTPFISPLINVEQGNPFNSISQIRSNIQNLGQGGIHFVRWFPTGEGANYANIPFGDEIKSSWRFGASWFGPYDLDTATNHKFSWMPYYYAAQDIVGIPGAKYRLTVRAKVTGDNVLRVHIDDLPGGSIDICSTTGTYHESQGRICNYKSDVWNEYTVEATNTNKSMLSIGVRGLYMSSDADPPYNSFVDTNGRARVSTFKLQRDETGSGGWGPNLLSRSDVDTHNYVDQVASANLDEIFRVSEQYNVYHKLTLFHKNDKIIGRIQADGSFTDSWDLFNFYSANSQTARWFENAYTRYFVARWSYSPALHSLELANENDPGDSRSFDAAISIASYVHSISPRRILMSNSFWHSFPENFWSNSEMDYGDRHLYAATDGTNSTVSSRYSDSASYVRQCRNWFKDNELLMTSVKPLVRGEGGVAFQGTDPQYGDEPDCTLTNTCNGIKQESTGVYYHKKVWAQVGILGYTCDGEWYPRTFETGSAFPNATYDTFKIYKTYENFIANEPINNGNYQEIGTDLTVNQQINVSNQTGNIRAYGVRDATAGKVLLWIDNANQTWKNVVDGIAISPAGGTLTVGSLTPGNYTGQWWDTRTGAITSTENFLVAAGGTLDLTVSNLLTDKAIKFSKSLCQPLGNIDCQGTVNVFDLSLLISKFGGADSLADLDGSGKVNIIDLSILLSNFGQ